MVNHTPNDAGWYLDEYDGSRFWERVSFRGGRSYLQDPFSRLADDAGECWTWRAATTDGYGRFIVFGKSVPAHRIGLLEFGGKLAGDQEVDHLCRNRACVRYNHLEGVTHAENVARGSRAQAITCKHGHDYTPENTATQTRNGVPVRICKTCTAASRRRSYDRRLEAAGKQRVNNTRHHKVA